MFINPFTIKNNLKMKKLTKILIKTGIGIFGLMNSFNANGQITSAQGATPDLKINSFYSYFFNYDSIKVNLSDRNKDKKIDKIDYICYLPKGEIISGQSQDNNFDESFETGKYRSFNKNGILESVGDFSLNFLSKAVKNYSEGVHKFYKN
ncbi:MAG: hypothetical protein QT10_C0004G0037 [archaeon GW2011_AR19]|nr:MAG: hypothetical protein QT10_C0004G0037 [archaeon GW2011_AR19]